MHWLRYNAPMPERVNVQKQELRQKCKNLRKGLGDIFRAQASKEICKKLADWDIFQMSKVVLSYMPIPTEVDLRPLFIQFPDKQWLLPRILPGEVGQMVFHSYDSKHLIQHRFGMAEPAPYLPQVSPEKVELVLAPGLAFDRFGWRLGYGGGYYDRFHSGFERVSIGVVFHELLLDNLPHGIFDIPMGWIVSEYEFFKVGR